MKEHRRTVSTHHAPASIGNTLPPLLCALAFFASACTHYNAVSHGQNGTVYIVGQRGFIFMRAFVLECSTEDENPTVLECAEQTIVSPAALYAPRPSVGPRTSAIGAAPLSGLEADIDSVGRSADRLAGVADAAVESGALRERATRAADSHSERAADVGQLPDDVRNAAPDLSRELRGSASQPEEARRPRPSGEGGSYSTEYLAAHCELDDGMACFDLGQRLRRGDETTPRDLDAACNAFSRACELVSPTGCAEARAVCDG